MNHGPCVLLPGLPHISQGDTTFEKGMLPLFAMMGVLMPESLWPMPSQCFGVE